MVGAELNYIFRQKIAIQTILKSKIHHHYADDYSHVPQLSQLLKYFTAKQNK